MKIHILKKVIFQIYNKFDELTQVCSKILDKLNFANIDLKAVEQFDLKVFIKANTREFVDDLCRLTYGKLNLNCRNLRLKSGNNQ